MSNSEEIKEKLGDISKIQDVTMAQWTIERSQQIKDQLNRLARFRSHLEVADTERAEKERALYTPELLVQFEDIKAEYEAQTAVLKTTVTALELEIKAAVAELGATVSGDELQAVWAKGRASWDTKALDGYGAAHPELMQFKTVGDPSVSIRSKGGK